MRVFSGRTVFVTGASSGIGKQLARDFLAHGARVGIVAHEPERLARAHAELSQVSPSVHPFVCDLADLKAIRRTAAAFVEAHGAPDVLINNAGYAIYRTIEQMDSEEIARLVTVNLTGACVMTREFLPSMIKAGRGHIVMMASIAGRVPLTPCGPYSTAKHGLVTFSEILRAELDRFHLNVHVICPGRVKTEFFEHESFVTRAPRRETEWTIPIESVSNAVFDAIAKNRFMTYVPKTYGPFVWLVHAMPFLFRPMFRRLMRARVESVYAIKQL